jgi:hypothetical protein
MTPVRRSHCGFPGQSINDARNLSFLLILRMPIQIGLAAAGVDSAVPNGDIGKTR